MNNKTIIYFIRHGQSLGNVHFEKNLCHLPHTELGSDLSELGEQQSFALAKQFKDLNIDSIYSSHLIRARRTIEPLAQQKKVAITIEKDLREIEEEHENNDEALARFLEKFTEICEINLGKTIIVIAHGVISNLFLNTLGEKYAHAHLNNVGYIKLKYSKRNFEVIEHLGLDLKLINNVNSLANYE